MSLNSVAPAEQLYIRITPRPKATTWVMKNADRVAKVFSVVEQKDKAIMYIIDWREQTTDGQPSKVIDHRDIELITEKEYFQGKLIHG